MDPPGIKYNNCRDSCPKGGTILVQDDTWKALFISCNNNIYFPGKDNFQKWLVILVRKWVNPDDLCPCGNSKKYKKVLRKIFIPSWHPF